jgi:hypothetical protein
MIVRINSSPIREAAEAVNDMAEGIKTAAHYLNPVTWYETLREAISSGAWDIPLLVGTIIGIGIWSLGANWPKKWIFWGWVVFWILRGVVFR